MHFCPLYLDIDKKNTSLSICFGMFVGAAYMCLPPLLPPRSSRQPLRKLLQMAHKDSRAVQESLETSLSYSLRMTCQVIGKCNMMQVYQVGQMLQRLRSHTLGHLA